MNVSAIPRGDPPITRARGSPVPARYRAAAVSVCPAARSVHRTGASASRSRLRGFQAPQLRDLQARIPGLPLIVRGVGDAVLAAGLGGTGFDFLEDTDDLFFAEFRLVHVELLCGLELYFKVTRIYEDASSEVKAGLARYFAFYNTRRPNSSLDRLTPDQFYFSSLPRIQTA